MFSVETYGVTQRIEFCYGHRLLGHGGKCAHPHGHNAIAELTFESSRLDSAGMVIDFGVIKTKLKGWIEKNLDHKMLLLRGDPLVSALMGLDEPVFEMDVPPTAENVAKLLYDQAKKEGLPVVEVRLWETSTQFATYRS
jgi:6-pyruvoyltetrahydropterin/6-carboxytetrahydropterin synthase